MNSKLMSYEEAKKQLKILELKQRYAKIGRNGALTLGYDESEMAKDVSSRKKDINEILTIIHLHKQSRKLWTEKEEWKLKYLGVPCE